MNTKKAKKFALPFVMVIALLMALSSPVVMAALPTEDGYLADHKKMNIYKQGAGDLTYSYGALSVPCADPKYMGEPFYCPIWNHNVTTDTDETATYNINFGSLPDNVVEARLYVYWTWSLYDEKGTSSAGDDIATYPVLDVKFNGESVSFDYAPGTTWIDNYCDSKNNTYVGVDSGDPNYIKWNFPAGTNCAMVDDVSTISTSNVVTVTNADPYTGGYYKGTKVCIQGVGLLLISEDDDKTYWIAEGNDMTYVKYKYGVWTYGITPDMTITKVKFPGASPTNKGTLTTVVPAGSSPYNRLCFNAKSREECCMDGVWNANPDKNLAVSVTDVSDCIRSRNNMAWFQNGLWSAPLETYRGDLQMDAANAFLVAE